MRHYGYRFSPWIWHANIVDGDILCRACYRHVYASCSIPSGRGRAVLGISPITAISEARGLYCARCSEKLVGE